ncbi:MAG TPA: hypothetical protein VJ757_07295 [Pseudonocardiaceae bacterium]|nr:hypothetical protein [Pseudonocardiaceae bacterium]
MFDVLGALAHGDSHAVATPPVLVLAGVGVVAVATVVGAWLARRRGDQRDVWFGMAAGALLVIAVFHLLPDAWSGASDVGMPLWVVPAVAVVSFALATLLSRVGCACEADEVHVGGVGMAAALAVHRFLEGSALALTASITVTAALAVHALGEGLAVGALLGTRPRRMVGWLAVMCLAPVLGAAVTGAIPVAAGVEPVLLAVAVGILAQACRISLRAAFSRRGGRWPSPRPAAAAVVAAAVTALAVYVTG